MWAIGGYSLDQDWGTGSSYTSWTVPGLHWHIGGAFLLAAGSLLLGVVLMFVYRAVAPPFFSGEVLNRDTMTLVPDDVGTPVGLFGIEPGDADARRPPGSDHRRPEGAPRRRVPRRDHPGRACASSPRPATGGASSKGRGPGAPSPTRTSSGPGPRSCRPRRGLGHGRPRAQGEAAHRRGVPASRPCARTRSSSPICTSPPTGPAPTRLWRRATPPSRMRPCSCADGSLPLLIPMSEVAGRMAPIVGANHLMRPAGGSGVLVCGVPGRALGQGRHPRGRDRRHGGGDAGRRPALRCLRARPRPLEAAGRGPPLPWRAGDHRIERARDRGDLRRRRHRHRSGAGRRGEGPEAGLRRAGGQDEPGLGAGGHLGRPGRLLRVVPPDHPLAPHLRGPRRRSSTASPTCPGRCPTARPTRSPTPRCPSRMEVASQGWREAARTRPRARQGGQRRRRAR